MSKDWGFDPLASGLARWRSFRQLHRLFLVCFVILAIFLVDRYRRATPDEGSLTLPTFGHGNSDSGGSGGANGDGKGSANGPDTDPVVDIEAENQAKSMENAGNSTLGFHSIYYINMKARYDREDAAVLQAYLSGIEYENFPAVEADMIVPVGMPPTHRPTVLKVGEKGCWRAHANIWSEMVRYKLPPVLILESDATWDINIRPIMSNLNKYFVEFLRKINSTAVHDPSWGSKNNRRLKRDLPADDNDVANDNNNHTDKADASAAGNHTAPSTPQIQYNPDDPWLSEHWDLFSIGQCFEASEDKDINLIFPDPHVPADRDYYGQTLNHERVVRKSFGIVCTTAYAISHTGAAKLLMRSAVDLDNPVDLLIRRLTRSGDLVVYSVQPPVIAQWEYRGDIGMNERGAQSDINGGPPKDTPKDAIMEGWDDVKRTGSVWQTKKHQTDVVFERMALDVAWQEILGDAKLEESQYNEQEKN
ncbi:hypothetical protein VTK26DRAFT_51 [Humicola hyalothermophila]